MDSVILGTVFLVAGLAAMFLMFHLWGYPFDKATRTSAAPRWAMRTHRALGYLFVLSYVLLMWRMVPRLWEYQVEFPARTTAHIILGFVIGFLLLVKIAIIRWFRHFEEWMPYLGTAIVLCTVVMTGLSFPYALQERARAGAAFSEENRERVARALPTAGLPAEAEISTLTTKEALAAGRTVLVEDCVRCHDLKTILSKPRTPSGWWTTVDRMMEKPALFAPMTDRESYEVTAYLIAITPDLQRASKLRHQRALARTDAVTRAVDDKPASGGVPPDLGLARSAYERVCSQCHELEEVDKAPPTSRAGAREMVQRMIMTNEAEISSADIGLITDWLTAHFVESLPKTSP